MLHNKYLVVRIINVIFIIFQNSITELRFPGNVLSRKLLSDVILLCGPVNVVKTENVSHFTFFMMHDSMHYINGYQFTCI